MSVPTSPQVLIVDSSPENREVLRTILQRDGVQTVEAGSGEAGLDLAKRLHPRVLVIDTDTVDLDDPGVCYAFDDEVRGERCSVVLLGRVGSPRNSLSNSEVMAKPYHYGPLIRKIEALLQSADP